MIKKIASHIKEFRYEIVAIIGLLIYPLFVVGVMIYESYHLLKMDTSLLIVGMPIAMLIAVVGLCLK